MEFLSAATFKRLIYLIVIVTISLYMYANALILTPGWLLMASWFLMFATFETTLFKRSLTIIGTGFIASVSVIIGGLVADYFSLTLLFLLAITAFSVWFGVTHKGWAYPMVIVSVLAVLSIHQPVPWFIAIERGHAVLCAVILVLAAQIIIWPLFTRQEYQRCRKLTFYHMQQFTTAVFTCLLSADYADDVYRYEQAVHKEKVKCMHGIVTLRELERRLGKLLPGYSSEDVQTIFELLADIGQLRRRVSDHTIFSLNATELANLEQTLLKLLHAMARGRQGDVKHLGQVLLNYIEQFDDSFENVVKVTSREPLVFILFNGGLNALQQITENAPSNIKVEGAHA